MLPSLMASTNGFLTVNRITKRFSSPLSWNIFSSRKKPAVTALEDVTFSLARGSTLAVLGPNGAGKTTLLKIIATLILPEKGTVRINGLYLDKNEEQIKSSIGLVASSERSFYQRLTGRQNLEFFAAMYGLDGKQALERTGELFRLFKVDYQDKRFDFYSAGMRQKFGLMRALLHDPAVLLLDEPTKSLDHAAACDFRCFIKECLVKKQNKTVLFTTHHMDEATDFADLFMVLRRGKISAFGTLSELRALSKNPSASLGEIITRLTAED